MGMRFLAAGLGLFAALVWAVPAEAAVTVQFVEPQGYTEAGGHGYDSERNLAALERHMVKQGGRCLRNGESLELRVLDVDLAGRQEWWRGAAYDLRVMREITWPRIELEYVWRDAAGALLGQGRERVADMSYLWRSGYVRHDPDALPYEKAMLGDWFERRFCRPQDR